MRKWLRRLFTHQHVSSGHIECSRKRIDRRLLKAAHYRHTCVTCGAKSEWSRSYGTPRGWP